MIQVLRQRNFALLWFAGLISMIGDWVLFIALPIHTYTLTHSSLATGVMFMAGMLPRIFVGSLAGVFVDRWDRRQTMVIADFSRMVLLLLLLLVRSSESIWIVYVVAFLQATISQFFGPAENARGHAGNRQRRSPVAALPPGPMDPPYVPVRGGVHDH